MSGGCGKAKPAGNRPLDGGVRRHLGHGSHEEGLAFGTRWPRNQRVDTGRNRRTSAPAWRTVCTVRTPKATGPSCNSRLPMKNIPGRPSRKRTKKTILAQLAPRAIANVSAASKATVTYATHSGPGGGRRTHLRTPSTSDAAMSQIARLASTGRSVGVGEVVGSDMSPCRLTCSRPHECGVCRWTAAYASRPSHLKPLRCLAFMPACGGFNTHIQPCNRGARRQPNALPINIFCTSLVPS